MVSSSDLNSLSLGGGVDYIILKLNLKINTEQFVPYLIFELTESISQYLVELSQSVV